MADLTPIFGPELQAALPSWLEELGNSDQKHLNALAVLTVSERVPVSSCLAKLFPTLNPAKAFAILQALEKRLNEAAEGDGHSRNDLTRIGPVASGPSTCR